MVAINPAEIRAKLSLLGKREWPETWDGQAEAALGDFLGWAHRYRLQPVALEEEVSAFEQRHAISLPPDYRRFLLEVGNGGAGPGYGIAPLGEGEEGPLAGEMLTNLSRDFVHSAPWNDRDLHQPARGYPDEAYYSYSVIAGSIEIATDGCALYHLLVVTGPAAGQMWYDQRTEGEGIAPHLDAQGCPMDFATWYGAWLDDVWERYGPA